MKVENIKVSWGVTKNWPNKLRIIWQAQKVFASENVILLYLPQKKPFNLWYPSQQNIDALGA